MKKALKWTGIGLAGLILIVVIAAGALYLRGGSRLNRRYEIPVAAIPIPAGASAVARGRHLAEAVTMCHGCHGENLGGDTLIDQPTIVTLYASNLTSGRGGVAAGYTDADYVRAIRHGVDPAGRGLMIMHSDAFSRLGVKDLGALIAYLKSLPPVDNVVPRTRGGPVGKVLVALGVFDRGPAPLIPAEVIDHAAHIPVAPVAGVTPEYGAYLVSVALCTMCHGTDLRGGPAMDEGAPAAPNIAVYAIPGGWTEEQFLSAIRTGVTPSGKSLDADSMPWEHYAKMTDDELKAIWRYLASLGL